MSKYDISFELNESVVCKNTGDYFLDTGNAIASLSLHKNGPVFSYNVMREISKMGAVRNLNACREFSSIEKRILIAINEVYRHTAGDGDSKVVFSQNQLYRAMGYDSVDSTARDIKKDVKFLSGTDIRLEISDGYFAQEIEAHALEIRLIEQESQTFFYALCQPILMEYIEDPFEFWSRRFQTMQKGM